MNKSALLIIIIAIIVIGGFFAYWKTKESRSDKAAQLMEQALLKAQEAKIEAAKPEKDLTKIQNLISKAIEEQREATELDPKNPEIWFQLGNIYFEIKDLVAGAKEWAIRSYEKALELDPDNPLYQAKLKEAKNI